MRRAYRINYIYYFCWKYILYEKYHSLQNFIFDCFPIFMLTASFCQRMWCLRHIGCGTFKRSDMPRNKGYYPAKRKTEY